MLLNSIYTIFNNCKMFLFKTIIKGNEKKFIFTKEDLFEPTKTFQTNS